MIEFGGRPTKNRSRSTINNAYALAGVMLGAAIFGYMGMWVLGIGFMAVALFLLFILVTRKLTKLS